MIVKLIEYFKYPVQEAGGTYNGRKLEPLLYGAKQDEIVAVGKTISEAINNCLLATKHEISSIQINGEKIR
jgi:hypothetical protein